jgi:hypothetical protein
LSAAANQESDAVVPPSMYIRTHIWTAQTAPSRARLIPFKSA